METKEQAIARVVEWRAFAAWMRNAPKAPWRHGDDAMHETAMAGLEAAIDWETGPFATAVAGAIDEFDPWSDEFWTEVSERIEAE